VGAISLSEGTAGASVAVSGDAYVWDEYIPAEFDRARSALGVAIPGESAPFPDAHRVASQLARASAVTLGADGRLALRLLARNALLLSGTAARLSNPGDNNAFCELAADDGEVLMLGEVEVGTDLLDALRRGLAGSAIANARHGVALDALNPVVFLPAIPNERVAYFEGVTDARDRLGISIRTVPVAMLLLAIRSNGAGLPTLIRDRCLVDLSQMSLAGALTDVFGELGDPGAIGLRPSK
jgi:hypothetical protein